MAINFNQVGFTYQLNTPFATPGLHDVNFTMPEGKFTAVIGHTGSGKSTMVQHLDGLVIPTAGEITIGEQRIFITKNDEGQSVIEVAENKGGQRNGTYTSYLKDDAIVIPEGTEYVWFKTKVRKESYTYEYSFNGTDWTEVPVVLDAAVLSDDYVVQSYGGFFTGAYVGLAAVDYSGYDTTAEFDYFDYKELGDKQLEDGSYSWEASESRFG